MVGSNHIVIDSPGSLYREVISDHDDFAEALKRVPVGPALVTIRVQSTPGRKRSLAAYINGHHVGWVTRDRTFYSQDYSWIKGLNRRGVLPRFKGEVVDLGDGRRRVRFLIPKFTETPAISEIRKSLPSAGWYPDPNSSSWDRYWDGMRWTDRVRTGQSGELGPK